ncbi:hypothetical protein [Candidatus Magnetaquicoccus inordinatus]|uniref:hypothetical protein n=1 Tax=Candidatus Magnetaquicoccus inordinatus TaxID=2496818 RepID=UPI00102B3728|nr:hypothetical protein [Candidatus Magnetaquicoccus inordinatus]
MTSDTSSMIEVVARIICRNDHLLSIDESVGDVDQLYTEESIRRAYPGQIESIGKTGVVKKIIDEIVDRRWKEFSDIAKEIVQTINGPLQSLGPHEH